MPFFVIYLAGKNNTLSAVYQNEFDSVLLTFA